MSCALIQIDNCTEEQLCSNCSVYKHCFGEGIIMTSRGLLSHSIILAANVEMTCKWKVVHLYCPLFFLFGLRFLNLSEEICNTYIVATIILSGSFFLRDISVLLDMLVLFSVDDFPLPLTQCVIARDGVEFPAESNWSMMRRESQTFDYNKTIFWYYNTIQLTKLD